MDFKLPAECEDLRLTIESWGRDTAAMTNADRLTQLVELGLFDVRLPESGLSGTELASVVVLEALAAAGVVGPLSESLWAAGTLGERAGVVAVPSAHRAQPGGFVPFGALAPRILLQEPGVAARLTPASAATPAQVIATPGHAWLPQAESTLSFAAASGTYAWRAAAALTVGYCSKGLAMAGEHARTRVQFSRPIGTFQAVQFRLAESFWRTEGLRLLVREAGWRADRDDSRADTLAALAWVYAGTVGRIVSRHVHQVFGAIGFSDDLGLARLTGAISLLRLTLPTWPASQAVWQSRGPYDTEPASTVLGGFRQAAHATP